MRIEKGELRIMPEVLRLAFSFALLLFSILNSQFSIFAQDDPLDLAPPPLKIVSRDELNRLDAASDTKARTKLSLEMMNVRLTGAEKSKANENYDAMFRELGFFHGLMENGLEFLNKRHIAGDKVLDNYKRLELGFRGYITRLETIRRDLPLQYEDYVRKLVKQVREARTKATEPMFSDSVVKTKNGA